MTTFRRFLYVVSVFACLSASARGPARLRGDVPAAAPIGSDDGHLDQYAPTRENKPYLRWWWFGSAVDREGLTYNLEEFAKAGIGGYEVTPVYGVKGNDSKDIGYLSPEWMDVYKYLVAESQRLDLECDLNGGTGWPFGGPQITPELAARKMVASRDTVISAQTGQKVKRAAPGGEGLVMDYYDPEALKTYLARFDKAFEGCPWPDTWFGDSYEVYGADWTPNFPEVFRERYGYDIRPYLQNPSDKNYARALADYRECLGNLLLENFLQPWVDWCHERGSRVRNQAHGSPANILDAYAMVDIPECETFGRTEFNLGALRKDPQIKHNDGTSAVLKFASSAAHVSGKRLVSCETLTWLTEHFRTSLSQVKPEIDRAFAAGVNHIYFHGAPYSPKGAAFPGWMFYASVNMSPTGGMWKDAPALFRYIERCQAFLSAGSPDSDFLLYFPVYDMWSEPGTKPLKMFEIHKMNQIMPGFIGTVSKIMDAGYDVDYISDKQLTAGKIDKPIIVPSCKYMPAATAVRLAELRKHGVKVYFLDRVPEDVPGLHALGERRREFRAAARSFGKAYELQQILSDYTPEAFRSRLGGDMIRRRNECGGWNYFVSMLADKDVDGWVRLATPAKAAMLFDPMTGTSGAARVRTAEDGNAEVYLQLAAGESMLIKTFPTGIMAAGSWNYRTFGKPRELAHGWSIAFPVSDPAIKGNFFTDKPEDWTSLDVEGAKVNFATAVYNTVIEIEDPAEADDWMLDLGDVRESARVVINGEEAGTVFAVPFRISIGKYLEPGCNRLEVFVTNLQSNRIADYDRRGLEWKIFKDANIAPLIKDNRVYYGDYPTDPSGLCSRVNLIPVCYDLPSAQTALEQTRLVNDCFMRKYSDPTRNMPFPARKKSYESNIWTRAVYYEGLMALYGVDPQPGYLDYAKEWGGYWNWSFRNGNVLTRNADNYCAAQTYIDLFRVCRDSAMIANAGRCFDNLLANRDSRQDWTWIDAIQMGMPGLIKYGVTIGRSEFFEQAWDMYSWTRDNFFNPKDGLWWRDATFCPPYATPGGRQCYWSRGNGWVMAALVRVLEELPSDAPHRDVYVSDLKAMAEALYNAQRADGLWNCSLADPEDFGGPEASGTSLFVYGLAWGVRNGVLSEKKFMPAIAKAWNGLNRICIHPNGFIGYSQGSGKEPKEAQPLSYDRIPDFEDFGTGCFLLAGSEIVKLIEAVYK